MEQRPKTVKLYKDGQCIIVNLGDQESYIETGGWTDIEPISRPTPESIPELKPEKIVKKSKAVGPIKIVDPKAESTKE